MMTIQVGGVSYMSSHGRIVKCAPDMPRGVTIAQFYGDFTLGMTNYEMADLALEALVAYATARRLGVQTHVTIAELYSALSWALRYVRLPNGLDQQGIEDFARKFSEATTLVSTIALRGGL